VSGTELPIDVIPGSNPPKFKWRQKVTSPIGSHELEYEGLLPPAVEYAVIELIALVKRLQNADHSVLGAKPGRSGAG
jgi:hypothetical protein